MRVTRDVVRDLLPLHVAGEASPDTRELVEEFLRGDPELARLAESMRAQEHAPAVGRTALGHERAALERTRTLLRRRSALLGCALLLTGLPLSFVFDSSGLRFLLIRDAPGSASALLAIAGALWVAFIVTARRLRVTGL